jgi:hypothetical protein
VFSSGKGDLDMLSMVPHMTTVFTASLGELLCQRNNSSIGEEL